MTLVGDNATSVTRVSVESSEAAVDGPAEAIFTDSCGPIPLAESALAARFRACRFVDS